MRRRSAPTRSHTGAARGELDMRRTGTTRPRAAASQVARFDPTDTSQRSTSSMFTGNVFEATGARPVWLTLASRPTKEEQWRKPHASAKHARRRPRTTESARTAEARAMAPGDAATEPIGSHARPPHRPSTMLGDAAGGHAPCLRTVGAAPGGGRRTDRSRPSRTLGGIAERLPFRRTSPHKTVNETHLFDFPSAHARGGNRPRGWDSRSYGACHDTARTLGPSMALNTRRPGGRSDRLGVRPMSSAAHIRGTR